MQTKQKAIEMALQQLFGNTKQPVCAVDASFSIIWQSHPDMALRLQALCARLQVSTTDGTLLLPADGLVDCAYAGEPMRCRLTTLPFSDEAGYLIQFEPLPLVKAPMDLELRTFLANAAEASRSTASTVLQATQMLHGALAAYQAAGDAQMAFDAIASACYQLLNQSARASELAWYAAADAKPSRAFPVIDVTLTLRQFVTRLRQLTNGTLVVQGTEIAPDLAAHVEAKRLLFILLTMVVLVQAGDVCRTRLTLSAVRAGRTIDLRLTASNAGEDGTGRLHAPFLPTSADQLLSMQALMQRFCDTFDAQWMRSHTEDAVSATLRLPAAAPSSIVRTSTALRPFLSDDRFSVYHVLLSEILRFPYTNPC